MEDSAAAWGAGNGVHSSSAMVMVASRLCWISIERSGVSRCFDPSMWLRKVTPSASKVRSFASDMIWNPPLSVRIGPGQSISRCSPPRVFIRSAPGRSIR